MVDCRKVVVRPPLLSNYGVVPLDSLCMLNLYRFDQSILMAIVSLFIDKTQLCVHTDWTGKVCCDWTILQRTGQVVQRCSQSVPLI